MENYGVVRKSSLAEIFDHSSCAICQSLLRKSCGSPLLAASTSDLAAQIKESTLCEALGKEKQLEHSEDDLSGSTFGFSNHVEGEDESKTLNQEKYSPEQCFLGSSIYYGGPDEIHDIHQLRKEGHNEVKMAVKQLEEAMDPIHLEYTTRGNWWQGSLYY